MNIKELKQEIDFLPDNFEILVWNGKNFKSIKQTSVIFSVGSKIPKADKIGTFNLEFEK